MRIRTVLFLALSITLIILIGCTQSGSSTPNVLQKNILDCEGIDNKDTMAGCFNAVVEQIIKNGNASICDEIKSYVAEDTRGQCVRGIALQKNDVKVCDALRYKDRPEDEQFEWRICAQWVAIKLGNASI